MSPTPIRPTCSFAGRQFRDESTQLLAISNWLRTASTICSGLGMNASPSGGLNGIGVCGPVTILTGLHNEAYPLSATIALKSVASELWVGGRRCSNRCSNQT
jgi:hypothetical protein